MLKLLLGFTLLLSVPALSQISDTSICSTITREYNEFDKEITLRTSLLKNCSLTKIINTKGAVYYLSLEATGSTAKVKVKGVKIILSNRQTLSFASEKIDVDVSDDGYKYSAFIRLTADKLVLFKKYGVLKWQLFIFDEEQSENDMNDFKSLVNCIVSMK